MIRNTSWLLIIVLFAMSLLSIASCMSEDIYITEPDNSLTLSECESMLHEHESSAWDESSKYEPYVQDNSYVENESAYDYSVDSYYEIATCHNINPFFFSESVIFVEYEGFFYPQSLREIWQNTKLTITKLAAYENGILYTLQINQIDTSLLDDPHPYGWDYISYGFEYLGYFFITNDIIYRRRTQDGFSDEEQKSILNAFNECTENALANNSFIIVASENGTERINQEGWYSYVSVDGDRSIFTLYHEDRHHATRHYERIVWEHGKGIVHFVTGIGAMRNHVEFGIDLFERYPDKRWMNGLWYTW